MYRRGRASAPVSALIAGCLGLGLLLTGQASAQAASSAPTATAEPVPHAAAQPSDSDPLTAPARLATSLPAYAPAACNQPDPTGKRAHCMAMEHTDADHRVVQDASGPVPTALTPSDIRAAYRLPDGGDGQTVALVDAFGYSTAEADLAHFRAQFGMPECTSANGCFRKVDQRGGTDYPADDAGWAEETALDLDAVSSACPKCHILLVEGDTNDSANLGASVETAVRLGAKFVSNSYGVPGEDPSETAYTYYDHPGVVVTASSGDLANTVLWPSSDPDVVAVGGTRLTRDATTDRGWTESAWNQAGSGCSSYEPQPAFQSDVATGCGMRATADIAADADPNSGLAVYDTLGKDGWLQVGGTSLSSPLVAAMYALAGAPAAGTYPVTYPYADQGNHLFDVVQGSSGDCGTVLCDAGPSWDGPTGLGTPNGVTALRQSPHGTLTGHVTDKATGAPLARASVVLTGKDNGLTFRGTTDASGAYHVSAEAGAYTVTASQYGYGTSSPAGVSVTVGTTATADIALVKVPSQKITGKVTDGSGHGWPLYAAITIDGYPNGAIHTDPKTGLYSVELPRQADYTLHVTPVYPGYRSTVSTVALGTTDARDDVALTADLTTCGAPGYAYPAQATFEDWSGTGSQHGWTVADNGASGHAWEFSSSQWNLTGGSGNFGVADPYDNAGAAEDTTLSTPVMDLTQATGDLQFDTAFLGGAGTSADVSMSLDGGSTWTSVWQPPSDEFAGHETVSLTAGLGHDKVRFRFHFTGSGQTLWELDNITVGTCVTVPGGLVTGTVTDDNSGLPVDGATVTDLAQPAATVASAATPGDPGLSDGFYWMFSKGAGRHSYSTSAPRYATATGSGTTAADTVTTYDVVLKAGRLAVAPGTVTLNGRVGDHSGTTGRTVTLTNTGHAPLRVTLGEQNTGYTTPDGKDPATAKGAPPRYVTGTFPTGPLLGGGGSHTDPPSDPAGGAAPTPDSWQSLPNYPEQIMDNAVAGYEGKTYSVGGVAQVVGGEDSDHGYVYDPATAAWSRIADLPKPLEAPSAAFVDGTLYVAGGWYLAPGGSESQEQSDLYAYDIATNTWSHRASLPQGTASASVAVLNGQLYVIGGCTQACASLQKSVYRYSPQRDQWTRLADYPVPVQWGACAGLVSEVVCAGGATMSEGHTIGLQSVYAYHPRSGSWTRVADMPQTVWAAASANGANGELQVTGGVIMSDAGAVGSNQSLQYDPVSNTWSSLPNAPQPVFRSNGSGCGIAEVGGAISHGLGFPTGSVFAAALPGFTQCGGEQVSWLSESRTSLALAPGQSVNVRIAADATVLADPGDYRADLDLTTDSPYVHQPVQVVFHVAPSRHYGG
ncbi:carboxypeptidase regulatory-like domain-containing protein [Streptomyces sp. HPF1205]|uniref:carboxypeptidase regulatory-like domain-containing protein n=1 Tax=Streptomyces sp. HPF1205 TaxID=2873262 RepID=UPI0021F0A532|nr:carboxypeptidase regulatory-like domain-containing protein [Streptomyces sp. HPF1205]